MDTIFTGSTTSDDTASNAKPCLRIADVKRDMELIREILLTVQDKTNLGAREIRIDGYDHALVARHLEMLHNAGYLDAITSKSVGVEIPTVLVSDLTWEGHDFLGAIADKTVFETVKRNLTPAQLASVPLNVIKEVATKLVVATLSAKLGL